MLSGERVSTAIADVARQPIKVPYRGGKQRWRKVLTTKGSQEIEDDIQILCVLVECSMQGGTGRGPSEV